MDTQFVQNTKHISFDTYLSELKLKCKGVHPPTARCNYCTPLTEISYKVKTDCKNHAPFPQAMCNKCLPPSILLKRQEYRHVDFVEILNTQEIGKLVQYWTQKDFSEQRMAYLYGYYAEDPNYKEGVRAIVEALYEPPQIGDYNDVTVKPDDKEVNANLIANALGLEKIGWIFTTLEEETGVFLTARQFIKAAEY